MGDPADEDTEERKPDDTWLTRARVAVRLGLSPRSVDNWVENGELHPITVTDENGRQVKKFDPLEVEALSKVGKDPKEIAFVDSLKAATALVEQATRHAEKLFERTQEPARILLAFMQEELEATRRKNADLLDKHLDAVAAYESLLSQSHEREKDRLRQDAADKRAEQAFKLLADLAPELMAQLTQGSKVKRLVTSLTEDQYEIIKRAEVLSRDQQELLDSILNRKDSEEVKPSSEEKKETPNDST